MPTIINKIFTILLLTFAATFAQAAPWGTVHGYKFNDLNGNGIDNAEPRLGGFQIVIQNEGGTFSDSDVTDAQGRYDFTNLPLQNYVLCEFLPANSPWLPTTPQCVNIEFDDKHTSKMVIFGNKRRTDNDLGCTRTQGFWGSSPQGQALVKAFFPPPAKMFVGGHDYTAAQLDGIFDAPVAGNALLILAHQLIAAKLNILNGASGAAVTTTIANADAAIGILIIPPIMGGSVIAPASPLGMTMTSLASDLDKYNNGLAGVPHCNQHTASQKGTAYLLKTAT